MKSSLAHLEGTHVRLNTTKRTTATAKQTASAILAVKLLIAMTPIMKKAIPLRIFLSIFTNFLCFLLFSSVYSRLSIYFVLFVRVLFEVTSLRAALCVVDVLDEFTFRILGIADLCACASEAVKKQS